MNMTGKQRTTIYLQKENYDAFKNTGLNLSNFCNDCIQEFLRFEDEALGKQIQLLDEEIRELEYKKYILTSRHSQDFEKKLEVSEMLPEEWKKYTAKAGDLYFGLCDISEFEYLRELTGLLKKDLTDIAEFIIDSEGRADYTTICNDFHYCIKVFNKEYDRNIRGDII